MCSGSFEVQSRMADILSSNDNAFNYGSTASSHLDGARAEIEQTQQSQQPHVYKPPLHGRPVEHEPPDWFAKLERATRGIRTAIHSTLHPPSYVPCPGLKNCDMVVDDPGTPPEFDGHPKN